MHNNSHEGFSATCNAKHHEASIHANKNIEPWKCHQCDTIFSTKYTLQRHRESQHLKIYKVVCKLCLRNFLTSYRLDIHIKNDHREIKQLQCKFCFKRYKSLHHLRRHEKELCIIPNNAGHEEENNNSLYGEKQIQCKICFKRYKSLHHLRRHEKELCIIPNNAGHEEENNNSLYGEKQIQCKICSKQYKLLHHLQRHEKSCLKLLPPPPPPPSPIKIIEAEVNVKALNVHKDNIHGKEAEDTDENKSDTIKECWVQLERIDISKYLATTGGIKKKASNAAVGFKRRASNRNTKNAAVGGGIKRRASNRNTKNAAVGGGIKRRAFNRIVQQQQQQPLPESQQFDDDENDVIEDTKGLGQQPLPESQQFDDDENDVVEDIKYILELGQQQQALPEPQQFDDENDVIEDIKYILELGQEQVLPEPQQFDSSDPKKIILHPNAGTVVHTGLIVQENMPQLAIQLDDYTITSFFGRKIDAHICKVIMNGSPYLATPIDLREEEERGNIYFFFKKNGKSTEEDKKNLSVQVCTKKIIETIVFHSVGSLELCAIDLKKYTGDIFIFNATVVTFKAVTTPK